METQGNRAHVMPLIYQAVLELIASLERVPASRAAAAKYRSDAIASYSAGWDDRHERQLRKLHAALHRSVATSSTSPSRTTTD